MRRVDRDVIVLAAAGVAMMALTLAAGVLQPSAGDGGGAGSSYATGSRGAKAAFLLLKRLDYRVERSFEPMASLRVDPSGTTIVLAAPDVPPSQQDRRALQAFLEAGGEVLAAGASAARFLPDRDLEPVSRSGADDGAPIPFRAIAVSPLTRGAPEIRMPPPAHVLGGDRYVAIYADASAPAVQATRIGQGRAIWWADPAPLTNDAIAGAGHAELLLNAAGEPGARRILWDEHYHGHTRSLWSYLGGTPLPAALAQALVLAAAAFVTFSLRRTPVRPVHEPPRADPLEFVETMGALYATAGAAAAAVGVARAHLRRRLAAVSGTPPSADDDRLARAAASRLGLEAHALADLLRESEAAARRPGLAVRDALALVTRLQEAGARSTVPASVSRLHATP